MTTSNSSQSQVLYQTVLDAPLGDITTGDNKVSITVWDGAGVANQFINSTDATKYLTWAEAEIKEARAWEARVNELYSSGQISGATAVKDLAWAQGMRNYADDLTRVSPRRAQ
jgi:CDP-glycerol glycerophosphotransferase (TagB/SpsB family)